MVEVSKLIDDLKKTENKGFLKRFLSKMKADDSEIGLRHDIKEAFFHIQNAVKLTGEFQVMEEAKDIILVGVGTSGIACDLIACYLENNKHEITVVRDMRIPAFADKSTLCFILSYTGDDHEAITAFRDANKKGSRIVGITSGGRLEKAFVTAGKEHLIIPKGLNECYSLPYLFFPVLKILENSGIVESQARQIEETINSLKKPVYEVKAKELASLMRDKIPIIYSSQRLRPVAERWKEMFNRISKIHSFFDTFPEAAHDDINGFSTHLGEFHCVFLIDDSDDEYIKKAMRTTKDILKNRNIGTTEIVIKGTNEMTKFISAIFIGDWTAFELSNVYKPGIDEEDIIVKFRKGMAEFFR